MDSVELIIDTDNLRVAMYCPVREVAFGPVAEGLVALEMMQRFIAMLPADPRIFSPVELDTFWVAMLGMIEGVDAGQSEQPPLPFRVTPGDGVAVDGGSAGDHPSPAGDGGERPSAAPDDSSVGPDGVTFVIPGSVSTTEATNPAPATAPSLPVEMVPIGKRKCWACNATGHEPDKPSIKCGICDGEKYLPA